MNEIKSYIEVEGCQLKLDLGEIFRAMSEDDQLKFIRSLALQSNIIEIVTDYICGEDKDGSWTSEEPNMRQKILERIEAKHVENLSSSGPRYGWSVWSDIQQHLKSIRCKQHVYWALTYDEHLQEKYGWDFIHNIFKRHGVESDYTTKQADADIASITDLIKSKMKQLSTPKSGG